MKSVQIRSYFWSVFSRIWTECGESLRIQSECEKIRTRNNSVFGHFLRSDYVAFLLKTEAKIQEGVGNEDCRPSETLETLHLGNITFK